MAIRDAVNRCIAEDILKKFLLERGEDVQKIMMFDLTYEKQMENAKREWYNDGVEEGRAEGYSSGKRFGAHGILQLGFTLLQRFEDGFIAIKRKLFDGACNAGGEYH